MKVLFLYTELSAYFLSCMNDLVEKNNIEAHVVHWPLNKEAPFQFTFPDNIRFYKRAELNTEQLSGLAKKISPDLIYCSGWTDKSYLAVCKEFRKKIPVVVGFDNKWTGSAKQQLAAVFSKLTVRRYFSHCWIPGDPQMVFARKLGFNDKNILTGFYSCDYDLFHDLYLRSTDMKKKKFPHRFIFAGRYNVLKGIRDLWTAFVELQNEYPNDWELWCLGTGDIAPIVHPKIKHFGFVQPGDMAKFISDTGVYILPSHFEPWGVSVHEFAAAGFPLICSDQVGSADAFLKDGQNGLLFSSGNIKELKSVLKKMMALPDEKLFIMGEKSAELAQQITPRIWSDTLMSVLNKKA